MLFHSACNAQGTHFHHISRYGLVHRLVELESACPLYINVMRLYSLYAHIQTTDVQNSSQYENIQKVFRVRKQKKMQTVENYQ